MCRQNFVIYSEDRGNMKIDYIITNPPYNKTLYLDILEYLIKNCSDSEIVSVNPNRPLVDILYTSGFSSNKNNPLIKYKKGVYEHIKSAKYFTDQEMESIFNIRFSGTGAIYHITPKETYNTYKNAFQEMNTNGHVVYNTLIKMLKKISQEDVLFDSAEHHKTGNLVLIATVNEGYIHGNLLYDLHKRVYKSEKEFLNNRKMFPNTNPNKTNKFINFKTHIEAQNFIEFFNLEFVKFFIKGIHRIQTPYLKNIPLLDMTQKWTNEKVCEYYDVTKKEYKACLEWYNEGKVK